MKRTKQPITKKKKRKSPTLKFCIPANTKPFGEPFYKMAMKNMGRPQTFTTPKEMFDRCNEYFQWVEENPFMEEKVAGTSYGEVIKTAVPKMRAMTIRSMCAFMGVAQETWMDYRRNKPIFSLVIKYAESMIYEQKFGGAAAGFLNQNIIARDLGLVDRQDVTSGDKPIEKTVIILPAKERIDA